MRTRHGIGGSVPALGCDREEKVPCRSDSPILLRRVGGSIRGLEEVGKFVGAGGIFMGSTVFASCCLSGVLIGLALRFSREQPNLQRFSLA